MKRGLTGKTFVISAALLTAVLFFAEAAQAQIFGRGLFRNRGNNNCCVTPAYWNNCCPSYGDGGYGSYGGYGNYGNYYGGYTTYGLNQGMSNWSHSSSPCACGTTGTYTGSMGYSSSVDGQSYDSYNNQQGTTGTQTGTYGSLQGYGQQNYTQGYSQQGYIQQGTQGHNQQGTVRNADGTWSNQFSQSTDTGLTSPDNQLNSNTTLRSDQQPNLQSGNAGVAGTTTTQSHQVLSVRPDGTSSSKPGAGIDNRTNQNIDSRIQNQNRNDQRPGDLPPGQNQYQPNRTDGTQVDQQSEAYTRYTANGSPQAMDQMMMAFVAKKFAKQNTSAAEMADQISDRLQSDAVKDLAKKLSEDHAALAEQFKNAAKSNMTQTSTGREDSDISKELGPYASLYKMCEIADKNQQEQFDQMVNDLSEQEIDMGYIGTLMVCHRTMLAELEAARETLQGNELSSVIDGAIEQVRNHLEQAEKVYEDLKS